MQLIGHTVSDEHGLLLAADPAVCEIMQRSARELIGLSYADLTHPADRARNIDIVERLRVFDGPARIRKRYVRPDGSSVWSDVRVSRLTTGGVGRLVGTIQLVDPAALARTPESLWRSARRALATIRRRRMNLGDDLFADHAWIILLQIYVAEAEGRPIDIAAIADGADIRVPLVERWIRALDEKRLVDRCDWPGCAAQMTATGIAKVEHLLADDTEE